MRDLTNEELKLAPDWATHWYFYNSCMKCIIFESESTFQTYNIESGSWSFIGKRKSNISRKAKQLPGKSFDITGYKFSESIVGFDSISSSTLGLSVEYKQWNGYLDGHSAEELFISINKSDAVAIAKALGVTGDDL
jgi:hypothetical protein